MRLYIAIFDAALEQLVRIKFHCNSLRLSAQPRAAVVFQAFWFALLGTQAHAKTEYTTDTTGSSCFEPEPIYF